HTDGRHFQVPFRRQTDSPEIRGYPPALERHAATAVVRCGRHTPLEPQMSKRKPPAASKRALSKRKPATAPKAAPAPKVTARVQRKKQEFVRSPKANPLRAVSTESPVESHDSKQETPNVENRAGVADLQGMLKAALQDDFSQKMRDNNPQKRFDFSSLIANLQAYQAKLLEVTQANTHFAFEFSQRLATTRSPFELFAV